MMYYERIMRMSLFEFFQYTNLLLISAKRVVSSFDLPCNPVQLAPVSSSLVNFTPNSFSVALCRCGALSKIVATVFLFEGVKTASVGTCAVGTCIEGAHKLEFVELGTPVTYCGTNKCQDYNIFHTNYSPA